MGAVIGSDNRVGTTIVISGNLVGEDDLVVEGRVEGTIELSATLTIGPDAIVKADVQVARVMVYGVLVGNIVATDSVILQAGCRMVGDIATPRIAMADGALFRGGVQMIEPANTERLPPPSYAPRTRPTTMRAIGGAGLRFPMSTQTARLKARTEPPPSPSRPRSAPPRPAPISRPPAARSAPPEPAAPRPRTSVARSEPPQPPPPLPAPPPPPVEPEALEAELSVDTVPTKAARTAEPVRAPLTPPDARPLPGRGSKRKVVVKRR